MVSENNQLAKLALSCLDLTSLNDSDTDAVIQKLCKQATTEPQTAAVCVEGRFVALAKAAVEGTAVKVATVVNFPFGVSTEEHLKWEIKQALKDGADEIDIVWHYHSFLDGDEKETVDCVKWCISELNVLDPVRKVGLKVILETSALEEKSEDSVARAAQLCLSVSGSDRITFLKTSTGKLASGKGASLTAVKAFCQAIKAKGMPYTVGIKVSGGVRTLEDANAYIELVKEEMGEDYVAPNRFRFGASGLWNALVKELGMDAVNAPTNGSY
jgi:deoxyribose-phosphate aldolase